MCAADAGAGGGASLRWVTVCQRLAIRLDGVVAILHLERIVIEMWRDRPQHRLDRPGFEALVAGVETLQDQTAIDRVAFAPRLPCVIGLEDRAARLPPGFGLRDLVSPSAEGGLFGVGCRAGCGFQLG